MGHAALAAYAVLVAVSRGYPPVAGRSHTCYSPVRRSPAACCHAPLPLDLHVLGLSLAFILSQDQTLRCSYLFFIFFFLCPPPRALAPRAAGHNGADPGPFIRLRFYLSPFQVSTRTPARRTDPPCAAANRRRPPFVFVISSVASFQCPLPPPEGRSCKGSDFLPFRQIPVGLFPRREPPFPVCGCKGTTIFPHKPNFFATFFKKILHIFTNTLSHSDIRRQKFSPFLCPKTCPRPKTPKNSPSP